MQPLDTVYLQILKNLCTDSSEPIPLDGVDTAALYRLAEKHCSLPFLLPYFEQQPSFSGIKQQTKQMLLSYYQLEHFTRLTFSLLLSFYCFFSCNQLDFFFFNPFCPDFMRCQ